LIGNNQFFRLFSLQAPVLVFHDLDVSDHRCIHAAVLRTPLVKRRTANPVLLAHFSQSDAALNLAQHTHDLSFRKSALPHQNLLVILSEKILPSMPPSLGEDYQAFAKQRKHSFT
jgi:hypothetical protein